MIRSRHLPLPRKLWPILCACLVLTAEAIAATRSAQTSGRAIPQFEVLPLVRSRQNHLLVRTYVNGKQAWLGVDSGAPVSAIALHRREYFRLKEIAPTSNFPARVQINQGFGSVAIIRNLRLGQLNLVDEPVVTLNLGDSAPAARLKGEQQMDGILGADILFALAAVLDCQRQVLILKLNPALPGSAPGLDYRGFSAVPMHVSEGFNLYVNAAINGKQARLMVDTGAFATLLHRNFVRQMRIPVRETRIISAAVNLKRRGVQVAQLRKLSVGSIDMGGKQVGVTDLAGLINGGLLESSPPVAGLLGAEILSRHHGIIDFGTRTLYLSREAGLQRTSRGTRRASARE